MFVAVDNVLYHVETNDEEIATRSAFQMRRRCKPSNANELVNAVTMYPGEPQVISEREARMMVLGHD